MLVCLLEPIASQYCDKKILSQVLRVRGGIALATNKEKNRAPIRSTKFGQRFVYRPHFAI